MGASLTSGSPVTACLPLRRVDDISKTLKRYSLIRITQRAAAPANLQQISAWISWLNRASANSGLPMIASFCHALHNLQIQQLM